MTETPEMDWAEGVGAEDLIAVGSKVIEMAEKLNFCPGAKAEWHFEMDGQRFNVSIKKISPQA